MRGNLALTCPLRKCARLDFQMPCGLPCVQPLRMDQVAPFSDTSCVQLVKQLIPVNVQLRAIVSTRYTVLVDDDVQRQTAKFVHGNEHPMCRTG
jgi:hypothetical protein